MYSRLLAILAIKDNQWVDFKVCEVKVDIDGVDTSDEVDEGLALLRVSDVGEKGGSNCCAFRERLSDGDVELECLCVHITDIYTTFMSEEDSVSLTRRGDANVEFGMRRVGKEGFDNEVREDASRGFDLKAEEISHVFIFFRNEKAEI